MLDKPISESANRLLFVHKIIKHIVCTQCDKIKKMNYCKIQTYTEIKEYNL